MGPLIPNEILPAEWSSLIALVIGIVFGFILESSGFSSSRKLAGVFYGYDFAVLKVFFTAGLVAVIGLLYLDYMGYIRFEMLYIHPTYLWGAIIGGIIMGVGFVAAGFCPGTGLCAVAIGKIDALVYVIGVIVGVFVFGSFYSLFEPLYTGHYLGPLTLMDSLGVDRYLFVFLFTLTAIFIFWLADQIRKRVKSIFYE